MNETDGNRLERLLGDRNRAAFARKHKIRGGGSMMSQQISGHRPISFESAVAYAQAFEVALEEISPSCAKAAREAAALSHSGSPTPPAAPTLAQALEVLGMALAHEMANDVREDAADTLSKLARRKGATWHQAELLTLLQAAPGKRQAAA